jgi:hypothetical protein
LLNRVAAGFQLFSVDRISLLIDRIRAQIVSLPTLRCVPNYLRFLGSLKEIMKAKDRRWVGSRDSCRKQRMLS